MVFTRTVRADVKRILTKFVAVSLCILIAIILIINAVSARTGMDIPVEIVWTDQSSSDRPSSVTLRLKDGNTEVSSLTLTSANQDPSNGNKWVGVFEGVPQSANYTIVEDNIIGYSISNNNASPTINDTSAVLSINTGSDRNGTVELGDANFVLIKSSNNNNRWYLWTLENYSGTKLTQLVNAFKTATGDNSVSIDTAYYSNDLPTSYTLSSFFGINETVTISGSEGNISYAHSYLLLDRVSNFYYGNVAPATSSAVSITNTEVPTYTLTVHHLNEDNTPFAADTVTTYNSGDTYTADPISNNRYISELTVGQATGTITQDIEVTYVYHQRYHDVIYQFTGTDQPANASSLLPATAEYEAGDTVTVAADPTATGYRFLGWQINGSPAGSSFTMPSSAVTITGSWERFNGYFAPTISKQVTNPQSVYHFGETVDFQVYVTNTASYAINNVEVEEQFTGANFVAASGYTIDANGKAIIPTIGAGQTVILYAEYLITTDNTETVTNTVELTAAGANNYYYLDPNQDYSASAQFNVQSWQDVPVLTGIKSNHTILYLFLMLLGAAGIGVGIVTYRLHNEEREE